MNSIQRFLTRKKVILGDHGPNHNNIYFWVTRNISYIIPYDPTLRFLVSNPTLFFLGFKDTYFHKADSYPEAWKDLKKKYDKQVSKILNQKKD